MLKRKTFVMVFKAVLFMSLVVPIAGCYEVPQDVLSNARQRLETRTKQVRVDSPVKIGAIRINPIDGAEMMFVPATRDAQGSGMRDGAFLIGSDELDEEKPVHEVEVNAFWMYRHEVANWQFALFVEATGTKPVFRTSEGQVSSLKLKLEELDKPIEVNHEQASAYCKWANARLPREAEWEWAAKGPELNKYPWGNELDTNLLSAEKLMDVGSFPLGASWCGVLDMAGNVSEWCEDYYGEYEASRQTNPKGPTASLESSGKHGFVVTSLYDIRVVRGGTWSDKEQSKFRTTSRTFDGSMGVSGIISMIRGPVYGLHGFRCAVDYQ